MYNKLLKCKSFFVVLCKIDNSKIVQIIKKAKHDWKKSLKDTKFVIQTCQSKRDKRKWTMANHYTKR